jgi:hypothetical protein
MIKEENVEIDLVKQTRQIKQECGATTPLMYAK